MRWSVGIEAEGERVFSREEIVELADAVAASDGIASGIGLSFLTRSIFLSAFPTLSIQITADWVLRAAVIAVCGGLVGASP